MMGMAGMMRMMGVMNDCPMMTATAPGPAAALERRKALGLTEEQVRQLEAARARQIAATRPAMDSMRVLNAHLAPLAEASTFDESRVRAVFERMGMLHADMGLAMLRARHEARTVLTPEQRKKLTDASTGANGMSGMKGLMKGMMGGTMSPGAAGHCPMMQGMTKGAAPADHQDHVMGANPSATKPSSTKP